jgi:hypothetical protein
MANKFEEISKDGKSYFKVPPNPSRMVRGMGNLSYRFEQAIADLVDNSIAAGATKIDILLEQRIGGKIYFHVLDNGSGISKDNLPAAIQYGAADRKDDSSLGVYGFGLKTACQSLTGNFKVVSKSADDNEYSMIIFDQDVIDRYDEFLFEVSAATSRYSDYIADFADNGIGTLVVSENADRLLSAEEAIDDKKIESFLFKNKNSKLAVLKSHLRKTFQRFLDVEDRRCPDISISVNGEFISPWDAFCEKEGNFLEHEWVSPKLKTKSGKEGTVILRGYILPREVDFENEERARDADIGPNTHGIYVYRENRLILQATYFNLRKRETHLSNLRIDLSYEGTLDELFHTGLQKGGMVLGDLEEQVRAFLNPLAREADARSRGNARRKDTSDIHDRSQKQISSVENRVPHAQIEAIDSKTAKVISKYGEVILPIPSRTDDSEVMPINPVESIDDGHLWQLRLQNGRQVVELNKGHDFYSKVYLPNKNNPIAVQGLDILLWSLAITEADCTIPEYKKQFREFRYAVSRALREIVESLPEPRFESGND